MTLRNWILAGLILAVPATSSAQDKKIDFNVGLGATTALGNIADRFGTGLGGNVGLTINTSERIGLQIELANGWMTLKDGYVSPVAVQLPSGAPAAVPPIVGANHRFTQLNFNVIAKATPPDAKVGVYVIAGGGPYNRKVEITKYEGTGIVCDPWLYVCGAYPVSSVLGSRSEWDFGMDVGGGLTFPIGEQAKFYVETRYHYLWGQTITKPAAITGANVPTNSNGSYMPVTFGLRF